MRATTQTLLKLEQRAVGCFKRYGSHRAAVWAPFLTVVVFLITAGPRVFRTLAVMGDSPELVTAAVVWGVPHAPGYPLYTLIGHAFSQLPFGDVAFRVHLTSVLFHAGALAGVVDAVLVLTSSATAAVGAGMVLMFSRSFFLGSLYAEVFPLNDLMLAWVLAFGARIARQSRPSARTLFGFSLLCGFACAHHMMIALAAPGLAILVGPSLFRFARGAPRQAAWWALGFVGPPLVFYGLMWVVAARDPAVSWGDIHDFASWINVLARNDYGGLFSAAARTVPGQMLERIDVYIETLVRSFGIATLLGCVGATRGCRRASQQQTDGPLSSQERGHTRWALAVVLLISGPAFAAMNAFDIRSEYREAFFERFATMSHVVFGVLVGLGLRRIETMVRGRVFAIAAAAIAVLSMSFHVRRLDFHEERLGIAYAHDLVAVPPGSLVLLAGDMPAHASLYACSVEHRCKDLVIFSPGQLSMSWRVTQLARRHPELGLSTAYPHELQAEDRGATYPHDPGAVLESLVRAGLARGPVYLHPELVRKHPHVRERFHLIPDLLLFRAYEDGHALDRDLRNLQAHYQALVSTQACVGCRAKRPEVLWRPSMMGQLLAAYADGLERDARSASVLGWQDEAKALHELALRFVSLDGSTRPKAGGFYPQ